MTPEIIRLLELSPDVSPKQVRKAYRKRRREIDPSMTRELERLDAAYAEFAGQNRSAAPSPAPKTEGYSPEQLEAMRFLGIFPGCSLLWAEVVARSNGKGKDEIRNAAAIFKTLSKRTPKQIAGIVLRKILAWLPALYAFPLYRMIRNSGISFFPGHSDPKLAEWFSGTLTASAVVSVLFTVTVPLLFISFLRRMIAHKRACRGLDIKPAAPLLTHDVLIDIDMVFLGVAVVLALNGPHFYRNTADYLADYRDMKSETYLSVRAFSPEYASNYNKIDTMGSLVSVGEDLVLDARDRLYDDGTPGSENGYVLDATYHYLPRTKLVHHVDVHFWRLADRTEDEIAELSLSEQALTRVQQLLRENKPIGSRSGSYYAYRSGKNYVWLNEQQQTMILLSSESQKTDEGKVASIVLDKDGDLLHEHTLTDLQTEEVFLLNNSDVILFARTTLQDPENFGASIRVIHLDGSDLSRIAQSEPQRVSPYDEVDFGKVGTDGIDATFKTTVYGGGTSTVKEEHRFFSIP